MNGLKVRDSNIEGKGLFADKEFNEGDVIGIAHINDVATSMIGRFHNHSDNPNLHHDLSCTCLRTEDGDCGDCGGYS